MRVVRELDAGPMLAVARQPIGPDETSRRSRAHAGHDGRGAGARSRRAAAAGPVHEEPQPDAGIDLCRAASPRQDAPIFWWRPPTNCTTRCAGCTLGRSRRPRSAASACCWRSAEPTPDAGPPAPCRARSSRPHGDRLVVAAGHGAIASLRLQPEGRRAMTARDFLAGHPCRRAPRWNDRAGAAGRARRAASPCDAARISGSPGRPRATPHRRPRPRADRRDRHRHNPLARAARLAAGTPVLRVAREARSPWSSTSFGSASSSCSSSTRVPASAVVDDAVSLTRRRARRAPRASSTACCDRSRDRAADLDLPPRPASIATCRRSRGCNRRCRCRGSHPRWLVTRWIDRLGSRQPAAWVAFQQPARRPSTLARQPPPRLTRDGGGAAAGGGRRHRADAVRA